MFDTDRSYGIELNCESHPKLSALSEQLFKDTGTIDFFNYSLILPDGRALDVGAGKSWDAWGIQFNKRYLPHTSASTSRLTEGINYWRRNSTEALTEAQEDARSNFDLDARIEFVAADGIHPNSYHCYSFGTSTKNADKGYRFYDIHRGRLLKFISHFSMHVDEFNAQKNLDECYTHIPDYQSPKQSKRNYSQELLEEGASIELQDREFEIMVLYANGCNSQQIADMLNKSKNTINSYLKVIRDKTNCHDKKTLHRYVLDHGWVGLERFFFNYLQ